MQAHDHTKYTLIDFAFCLLYKRPYVEVFYYHVRVIHIKQLLATKGKIVHLQKQRNIAATAMWIKHSCTCFFQSSHTHKNNNKTKQICVSTTELSTQNVFLWVRCEVSLPEDFGKMLLSAVRKCCHSSASCHTGTSWSIRWGWHPVAGSPAPTHSSSLRWWTHPDWCDLWS